MKYTTLLFLSLLSLSFLACKKEEKVNQAEVDKQKILDYAKAHNLSLQAHESGIYYLIEKAGNGTARANIQSLVTVKYTGKLLDGNIFDSSNDQPYSTLLSEVIEGWQIAIPLMQRKEKTLFFIPSGLGYGERGSGSIPANSVLIFEIELLNF